MSPTVAKRKSSPVKRTRPLTDEGSPTLVFGITFDLNGTAIPVTGIDPKKWKEEGGDLKLPEPIKVGSIDGFIELMQEKFGVTIPKPEELPKPLNEVVKGITSMEVTVYKAEVHIPGTKKPNDKIEYLIEVGGLSKTGIPLLPGTGFPLTIQGLSVGATNKKSKIEAE